MKILLNAVAVRGGGPETFLLGLLPELLLIDKTNEYVLLVPEERAYLYSNLPNYVNIRTIPSQIIVSTKRRLIFEHFTLTHYQQREKIDLHFRVDELLSPLTSFLGIPTIAVFHATQHMLIPEQVGDSRLRLFYLQKMKSVTMRTATIPVTVSHHARAELSGLYPFAHQRIRVIYHGINHSIFKPGLGEQLSPLEHLGIGEYLLSVSDRHTHKNFYRLIQAYSKLVKKDAVSEHLVIIGRAKSAVEEQRIQKIISSDGLRGRVHLLDYVEHSELVRIYQRAAAYIFPSTFETFGFTPLEAMACGTPVASSQYSAMPEVCGDAVEYFNPLSVESIADAIKVILEDQEHRQELIQLGFKHAQQFTWKKAAQQYYDLMQHVAQRGVNDSN